MFLLLDLIKILTMLKSFMTNFNSAQVWKELLVTLGQSWNFKFIFKCCFLCSESPSKPNCFQFFLGFSGLCFSAGLDLQWQFTGKYCLWFQSKQAILQTCFRVLCFIARFGTVTEWKSNRDWRKGENLRCQKLYSKVSYGFYGFMIICLVIDTDD